MLVSDSGGTDETQSSYDESGGSNTMAEIYDSSDRRCDTLGDALRFLCDASYAVLPRDAAHQLGEFQKNFWGGVRWLAEQRIDWITERVAGGDKLREEWRRRAEERRASDAQPESIYGDSQGI